MPSLQDLSNCLGGTLSSNPNERMTAELKLSEYLQHTDTGLALSQIVVEQQADIALRQMSYAASIALRRYVRERWSPYFATFKGSPPPVDVKSQIRAAVFSGLSDPNRKIRALCAHVLSSIANADWPDEYPDLLTSLIHLLSSGSTDSVHGAMQVFTEFIKADLTEDQLLPVLRDLLPSLLNILGARDIQGPLTRARVVTVFDQCVKSLYMVKEQHPASVKEATASVMPIWLEAFRTLLSVDPLEDVRGENWDGLAVRFQIYRALDTIQTSFPRAMAPFLNDIMNISLGHLQNLLPLFTQYYVSSTDTVPVSEEEEAVELPRLIGSILDFTAGVARSGRAKDWVSSQGAALVTVVFSYALMTDDDEELWTTDANAFVAQEDEELQHYSVRLAGFDLLGALIDRNAVEVAKSFQKTITDVISSSSQNRDTGAEQWWRPLEGALAAIGSQAESVQDCIDEEASLGNANPIDIENLLVNIIPTTLALAGAPFLQGRGFVFASQYAKLLPVTIAGKYLEAAITVLENPEAGIPVKISAVKAILNFCTGSDESALRDYMPKIATLLGPFLIHTSEDTLSLVLETLAVVADVDNGSWITPDLARALVDVVLDVWRRNIKDPIFLSMIEDIFKSLAASSASGVGDVVLQQALPGLSDALIHASVEETWIASSALGLLVGLVRGTPSEKLSQQFFSSVAPGLFKCLAESDDRGVLENGIIFLTIMTRKNCGQIIAWKDGEGTSGLEYVLRLVAKQLRDQDESGGLVIGDLIIQLMRQAGEAILPVVPELLKEMISRMRNAKTATYTQSLIIPFAFMINNQRDAALTLIEGITVDGRPGLDILLNAWCENAETFQGFWASRTSTMGLSHLFATERPALQNLTVKGDMILKAETKDGERSFLASSMPPAFLNHEQVIMTRSRTKSAPTEFTSVPFPVKALKILIHDIQTNGESATIPQADNASLEDDDGDEEWDDDQDDIGKGPEFQFLSDYIGPRGIAFDNEELLEAGDDDDDLKNDPISQMNMQEHLVTFLRECRDRNTNNFEVVVKQLSAGEMNVLTQLLT